MNIFVLDEDPEEAAKMLCDAHVVKMTLESAQILSVVQRLCKKSLIPSSELYRLTHPRHPCIIWAGLSLDNYMWTVKNGLALAQEFRYRYGKKHASSYVIDLCGLCPPTDFDFSGLTDFAQAMPAAYRGPNAVEAYRKYYVNTKSRFARWARGREAPDWYTNFHKINFHPKIHEQLKLF